MASLLFWGTKYIRKGKFFCSFELLLGRSYIMKECKVSVWNKVKEVDVKQDNLKKSEGKKNQKEACTKIQKSYKKGGIKRKKENSNQEEKQTAGIQQRVQRGRRSKCLSGNSDKRRKKMKRAIWWEPQEATQAEGVRLTLSLSWQASLSIHGKN